MQGVPARYCSILIDEFDFSTDLMGGTISLPVESEEIATLQMDALGAMPLGAGTSKLEISGYYNGYSAGDIYKELQTRQSANTLATAAALLDTTALGNPAYVLTNSWLDQLSIEFPARTLLTLKGAMSANPMRHGNTVANQQMTATAQGVVDMGIAGSAGCTAYLFVRGITGTPSGITVKLQGATSSGFGTPVDLGTWTSFTAVGCKVLTVASGTVHRYLRLNVTGLGGATNFTACAIVCVPGVTE